MDVQKKPMLFVVVIKLIEVSEQTGTFEHDS